MPNNRGRSTTGGPAVPYYRRADHIEAAKHLRLTVTRYIADRASLADIDEAVTMLRSCAPVADETGYRKPKGTEPEVTHPVCGPCTAENAGREVRHAPPYCTPVTIRKPKET